jgi:hypothetical protein
MQHGAPGKPKKCSRKIVQILTKVSNPKMRFAAFILLS